MKHQFEFFSHNETKTVELSKKQVKKFGGLPSVSVLVFDQVGRLEKQDVPVMYDQMPDGSLAIIANTQCKNGYLIIK